MENPFEHYDDQFSEEGFWAKLKNYARKAGTKVVYSALLLFYAYKRKETPAWAKRIVIGTLGYFLSPIDLLPDLSPIIGYTDDLAVLAFGLSTIAIYINQDVKTNARAKLNKWFGKINEEDIKEVEDKF